MFRRLSTILLVALVLSVVVSGGHGRAPGVVLADIGTGTAHIEIDADATNGTAPCNPVDHSATVAAASKFVAAICLEDSDQAPVYGQFEVFILSLFYDPTKLFGPNRPLDLDRDLDANPDLDQIAVGDSGAGGWDCNTSGQPYYLPPLHPEVPTGNPSPATLACKTIDDKVRAVSTPVTHLADVTFYAGSAGTTALTLPLDGRGGNNLTSLLVQNHEYDCAATLTCIGATITIMPAQCDPGYPDVDNDGVCGQADNCPTTFNPDQANTDGAWSNGPDVPGDDTTVPNGDALGDACDADSDGDGRPDSEEKTASLNCPGLTKDYTFVYTDNRYAVDGVGSPPGAAITSPPPSGTSWDSDGDTAPDGVECALGTDPRVYHDSDRTGCFAYYAPGGPGGVVVADADGDGLTAAVEKCKWNTDPNKTDTDGDGLGDCREAYDINGNAAVNLGDTTLVLRAFFGLDAGDLAAEDVNGNGMVDTADAMLIKRAFFGLDPCM